MVKFLAYDGEREDVVDGSLVGERRCTSSALSPNQNGSFPVPGCWEAEERLVGL
jgi:hypothetical protein